MFDTMKKALVTTAAASALVLGMGMSPAFAVPQPIFFTWNPGATTPALSITGTDSPEIIGASSLSIENWGAVYSPAGCNSPSLPACGPGAQIEHSFIVISGFDVNTPGLTNSAGSAGAGASPYVLFFDIAATGHYTSFSAGNFSGVFDSLSYTLYGYGGGIDQNGATSGQGTQACLSVTSGGSCVSTVSTAGRFPVITNTGGTGWQTLATGSLMGGQNTLYLNGGVPGAGVSASFIPNTAGGIAPFFVAPNALITLDLESAFNNTGSSVNTFTSGACGATTGGITLGAGDLCFALKKGGGNATLAAIPEPATLSLLGVGLLGMGLFGRRRDKKQAQA